MKKNTGFRRFDNIWVGIILGVLIPVIALTLYYHYSTYAPYIQYLLQRGGLKALWESKDLLSRLALVSLLPNAAGAFIAYKLWLWDTFKGLLMTTLFLLVPCMYFFVA